LLRVYSDFTAVTLLCHFFPPLDQTGQACRLAFISRSIQNRGAWQEFLVQTGIPWQWKFRHD